MLGGGLEGFARSPLARVLSIAALLLVLRVPVGMVRGLIEERQARRAEVVREVTEKWGREQALMGPVLVVPYSVRQASLQSGVATAFERTASFLPEVLSVDARSDADVRRRGIFEIPVYATTLSVRGRFAKPDFSDWSVDPEQVAWDRAELFVGVSDPRVIQDSVRLQWDAAEVAFDAGGGRAGLGSPGIHAGLPDPRLGDGQFAFTLRLHGSSGLDFAPFGRETSVRVASDWPHPSFRGQWLPSARRVDADGFEATWQIPYLGRSYPQRWTSDDAPGAALAASRFGVGYVTPVDPYRLAERSAKYDTLFLGLTFLSLWLFEVLVGIRVHAVQYLMVGAAMSLFYLLLLAFSEHFGFGVSYAIAAGGVIALIASYAAVILAQRRRAAAVATVTTALYGYLFVLLHNEDHALVVGSVGLFWILAIVMWLTRDIDWHRALPEPAAALERLAASRPIAGQRAVDT